MLEICNLFIFPAEARPLCDGSMAHPTFLNVCLPEPCAEFVSVSFQGLLLLDAEMNSA